MLSSSTSRLSGKEGAGGSAAPRASRTRPRTADRRRRGAESAGPQAQAHLYAAPSPQGDVISRVGWWRPSSHVPRQAGPAPCGERLAAGPAGPKGGDGLPESAMAQTERGVSRQKIRNQATLH